MANVKPWHQPPKIMPNYGKRKSMGPKTNLTQVLLHDNVNQQQFLDSRLRHIHGEERRSLRLMDLHKKSFMVQQSHKQAHLRSIGIYHISYLPDMVANSYLGYRNAGTKSANEVTRKRATLDTPSSQGKSTAQGNRYRPAKSATFNLVNNTKYDNYTNAANTNTLPEIVNVSEQTDKIPDVNKVETADVLKLEEVDKTSEKSSTNAYKRSQSAFYDAKGEVESKTKNFSTYNYRREKTFGHPGELRKSARNRFRQRSTKDPRFRELEKSLIVTEDTSDGFVQLSPSGNKVLEKYGKIRFNNSDMQSLFAKHKTDDYNEESPRRCRLKQSNVVDGEITSVTLPVVAFKENSLTAEDFEDENEDHDLLI